MEEEEDLLHIRIRIRNSVRMIIDTVEMMETLIEEEDILVTRMRVIENMIRRK